MDENRLIPFALFAVFACFAIHPRVILADADDEKPAAAPAASQPALPEGEVRVAPEAIKRYGIATAVAKKQKLTSHLVVPARVSFNTQAMAVVGCPVQGRVSDLRVAAGDVVKQGDVLMVVESPELGEAQSDYLLKRAALDAAAVAVAPAQSAYDRAKTLYEQSRGIPLTELEKRKVELQAAKSAVLTAEAGLKAAGNKLHLLRMDTAAIDRLVRTGEIDSRYEVRAPIPGTVTELLVTLGELVKPDRERLVVLADMTTLWVLADVPESRLAEVRVGSKAAVTVAAAGDRVFDGKVAAVGFAVDPATRTVRVRLAVKSDPVLKPGMFAQADITASLGGDGDANEAVLAVPAAAVQTVDSGSTAVFVPVKGEPGIFSRRLVSVGDAAGGMVSILSGLEEGEKVVTAGSSILKAEYGKSASKDED